MTHELGSGRTWKVLAASALFLWGTTPTHAQESTLRLESVPFLETVALLADELTTRSAGELAIATVVMVESRELGFRTEIRDTPRPEGELGLWSGIQLSTRYERGPVVSSDFRGKSLIVATEELATQAAGATLLRAEAPGALSFVLEDLAAEPNWPLNVPVQEAHRRPMSRREIASALVHDYGCWERSALMSEAVNNPGVEDAVLWHPETDSEPTVRDLLWVLLSDMPEPRGWFLITPMGTVIRHREGQEPEIELGAKWHVLQMNTRPAVASP